MFLFIFFKLNCSKQPCVHFNFSHFHLKIINFAHFLQQKSENTLSDITIISDDRNKTKDIIICHRTIAIKKGTFQLKLPWLKRFMNELKIQQISVSRELPRLIKSSSTLFIRCYSLFS